MSRKNIISSAVAAGKPMKKPFNPKSVALLHQGQNSSQVPPRTGKGAGPYPLKPNRRQREEQLTREKNTGFAA